MLGVMGDGDGKASVCDVDVKTVDELRLIVVVVDLESELAVVVDDDVSVIDVEEVRVDEEGERLRLIDGSTDCCWFDVAIMSRFL